MQKLSSIALPSALFAALFAGSPSVLAGEGGPAFIVGDVSVIRYDQSAAVAGQDLLTAGLGAQGIGGAAPAAQATQTALSLRQLAIYNNYRALVDPSDAGGYGRLYGPNVGIDGVPAPIGVGNDGKINGTEYIAYTHPKGRAHRVTMMVQVPDSFDPAHACIVTATSSGSRGIYGAIATSGEWGLKHGCAVAYTDKGTGSAYEDLDSQSVTLRDGIVVKQGSAPGASFEVPAEALAAYQALPAGRNQFRVAVKHAHSQLNPERDWGRDTLDAIRFAYDVLNRQFGAADASGKKTRAIHPGNTIVIASSASNGAGAALLAKEVDEEGLINGIAVSEPQIQPRQVAGTHIVQGGAAVATFDKPLADYFTLAYIYQPCAALSTEAAPGAFSFAGLLKTEAVNRCAQLKAKGLLQSSDTASQAEEALQILHQYGYLADSDFLQPQHFLSATGLITTYVNAYGGFDINQRPCGYSFANTDAAGMPLAQNLAGFAAVFGSSNGVPASSISNGSGAATQASAVNVVYDDAIGGPTRDLLAQSQLQGAATGVGIQDFGLDGALCLRSLVLGRDARSEAIQGGAPLTGTWADWSGRVREGMQHVLARGNLHGTPAVIVAGRSDALVPVNHAARAYVAVNSLLEGAGTRLHYYEVTNANHFDAFLPLPVYKERLVPLHVYLHQALDLMWAHLTAGAPLPASQVVRTTPRGTGAPPLSAANVPAISASPAAGDVIQASGGMVTIPQ